ncbi:MAG: type sorting protein, partial [Verrucomicrobiaceae bacterium]|nr:type sorting protein [Verrucomicrobiaceae bacterium]
MFSLRLAIFAISMQAVLLLPVATQAWPAYEVVASFDLPPVSPGYSPLVLAGDGYYWGTTRKGGTFGEGTIYKTKADGSDWTVVYSFPTTSRYTQNPTGGLVSDGAGYLWGTTERGGANYYGTVFKIHVATGAFLPLLEFANDSGIPAGSSPEAALTNDGAGYLWGTTASGGSHLNGTIFKINISTGALSTVANFSGSSGSMRGASPYGALMKDETGVFWGTTLGGGANGKGTVFKISGGTFSTVLDFTDNGSSNKGSFPWAGLVSDGAGYRWGTTSGGGASQDGTVFKINASTGVLTTVVEFTGNGAANRGLSPLGALISDGAGFWWGTTSGGGSYNRGTVFKIDANTGGLTTVLDFDTTAIATSTASSISGLASDGAGSFLGTAAYGGASGNGLVYKVNAVSGTFSRVADFFDSSVAAKGNTLSSGLIADGVGYLWGTTEHGGAAGMGTVFKMDEITGAVTRVVQFTGNGSGSRGAFPKATLVNDDAGNLWGTTYTGGIYNLGTIFKVALSTGVLTTVVDFANNGFTNWGAQPLAGLVKQGSDYLWGTTQYGGNGNAGTVFKVARSNGLLTTVSHFSFASAHPVAALT